MIKNSTIIFGPPGCGKTYTLMEIIQEYLDDGGDPSRIAFISFTRKAIAEAVERACSKFSLTEKELPHFKTLHATAFWGLGLQPDDLMKAKDYKELGDSLGIIIDTRDGVSPDDGLPQVQIGGSGKLYLDMVARARSRRIPLQQEYNEAANYTIWFSKLQQVEKQLQEYKSKMSKVDFADFIEKYIEIAEPPYLDLLIVDEAQDLTPVQWEMVNVMSKRADKVYLAGDDDQAIHRWTGVDVNEFLKASEDVQILTKSYRMPVEVFNLSRRIVKRIRTRKVKEFTPAEEQGTISWHNDLGEVPLDQGSWTIMARTNGYVSELADTIRSYGFLYSIKGRPSIKPEVAEGIEIWRRLQNGERVGVYLIKNLYKNVPKQGDSAVVKRGSSTLLEAAPEDGSLSYDDLVQDYGMKAPLSRSCFSIMNLGRNERLYIEVIEDMGESIMDTPRIKLSTFHAMKGGEDDNCLVYTGSTKACVESKHPDDEHRAFYVGVTRTKKNLHILESAKKYRYEI